MEALGINITSILIYTILFVLIYFISRKFFLDKLVDTLAQRQADIKKGIELRESMEAEMKKLEQRQDEVLAAAKEEAKNAVGKAMADAKEQRKQLLEDTKKEAEQIIAKANERLEQERGKLEADLNAKVEAAAMRVVKEVYKQDKANIDRKLIDAAIKEL